MEPGPEAEDLAAAPREAQLRTRLQEQVAADEGAELNHFNAGLVKTVGCAIEIIFGQIVNVLTVDAAGGKMLPAQCLGGLDLCFEGLSGFVCES